MPTKKTDPVSAVPLSPVALNPTDILTPKELSERLKVPESWVREKTRSRCPDPMPCLRIGRYVRFDWRRVTEWLASTERQAS